MARMNLSKMPSPPKEYVVSFPRLDGGLNTWELDYRLDSNESPEMVNLWWKDGALRSRDGQIYMSEEEIGACRSVYDGLFHDRAFFHLGNDLYYAHIPDTDVLAMLQNGVTITLLHQGVGASGGTWFRYGDKLYYKNKGNYLCISVEGEAISCAAVTPYSPIILINAEPTTAAGDEYQGENRLCAQKTVWYSTVKDVKEYHLPVKEIDSVDKVVVDGEELTGGYTVDLAAGKVTFDTAPEFHEPVQVNTVRITFSKANPEAYNSIMECGKAAVYGGDQNVCVVLAGCSAQPNAYFWCGNHAVMDPGYFPFEQYNLAGDAQDKITGFGKQQNMLVIFKERSIGRTALSTQEMASGRTLLTMNYTAINATIGCDLPESIQLVENNLVFASSRFGVCIVRDSSAAYENNITPISRKVDNGLLKLLQKAESVCSHDDGERYWIAADSEVYLWDYALSEYSDPVWFYFTNIAAKRFLTAGRTTLHMDSTGKLTAMHRVHMDYDGAIHKLYRFAAQSMGSYERLKDVVGAVFVVQGDTNTWMNVTYKTDYEVREDLTPVRATSWRLVPRDLSFRELGVRLFAHVAQRKPGCRHIRHFVMTLENNAVGMDMAVISAQITYRFQGRDR